MGAENIDYESGASYIHTSQARTLLMQKLMEGRDMGEMSHLAGNTAKDEGQSIRAQNYANLNDNKVESTPKIQPKQEPTSCILIKNMFDPL